MCMRNSCGFFNRHILQQCSHTAIQELPRQLRDDNQGLLLLASSNTTAESLAELSQIQAIAELTKQKGAGKDVSVQIDNKADKHYTKIMLQASRSLTVAAAMPLVQLLQCSRVLWTQVHYTQPIDSPLVLLAVLLIGCMENPLHRGWRFCRHQAGRVC